METKYNRANLSEREFEVMVLVSSGKYNKEIADMMQRSTNTIRKHLQHIFPKLGVQNRTEACIAFMKITGKINPANE
jgi:DNA-binding NarL/FixJ family response regulator